MLNTCQEFDHYRQKLYLADIKFFRKNKVTMFVAPQVVNKFDCIPNQNDARHPERSEGSPKLDSNPVN
jgi:hypothetical protein